MTVQGLIPVQAPPQPRKVAPAGGEAVNVTVVPWLKFWVQVAPQLIPAGELVTVPVAVPVLVTVTA